LWHCATMLATRSPSSYASRGFGARPPPSSWTAAPSSSTASLHAQRSPANSVRRATSSSDQYRIDDSQDVELHDLAAMRESFLAVPAHSSSRTSLVPSPKSTPSSPSKTANKPAVPEVDPNEPLDPHLRAVYLLAKITQRSPQIVTDMLPPPVPPMPLPSTTPGSATPTPPNQPVTPVSTLMRTKRVHGLMEVRCGALRRTSSRCWSDG